MPLTAPGKRFANAASPKGQKTKKTAFKKKQKQPKRHNSLDTTHSSVAVPGHSKVERTKAAGTFPGSQRTGLAAPQDGRTPPPSGNAEFSLTRF